MHEPSSDKAEAGVKARRYKDDGEDHRVRIGAQKERKVEES